METLKQIQVSDAAAYVPQFGNLEKTPASTIEGLWFVAMAVLSLCLFGLREYIVFQNQIAKDEKAAQIEEEKLELAQRDALIKYLQQLNQKLIEDVCSEKHTNKCNNCELK